MHGIREAQWAKPTADFLFFHRYICNLFFLIETHRSYRINHHAHLRRHLNNNWLIAYFDFNFKCRTINLKTGSFTILVSKDYMVLHFVRLKVLESLRYLIFSVTVNWRKHKISFLEFCLTMQKKNFLFDVNHYINEVPLDNKLKQSLPLWINVSWIKTIATSDHFPIYTLFWHFFCCLNSMSFLI